MGVRPRCFYDYLDLFEILCIFRCGFQKINLHLNESWQVFEVYLVSRTQIVPFRCSRIFFFGGGLRPHTPCDFPGAGAPGPPFIIGPVYSRTSGLSKFLPCNSLVVQMNSTCASDREVLGDNLLYSLSCSSGSPYTKKMFTPVPL